MMYLQISCLCGRYLCASAAAGARGLARTYRGEAASGFRTGFLGESGIWEGVALSARLWDVFWGVWRWARACEDAVVKMSGR